jgi:DNA-directed RNA polymerase subunit RPC12/RpoP
MSTLEVTCARCEKKFRVRAEFAGRSTRCPGCSAPITIGGDPRPAPPPKRDEEERPRPKRRDDDDDEPRRPEANWRSARTAFQREQVAVIFALIGIFGNFFNFCIVSLERHSSDFQPVLIFFVLLFGLGPSLVTTTFGLMARISALGAPKESLARGSAKASLFCNLAGLASLVVLALTLLASIGESNPDPLPMVVAIGGVVLSGIASMLTFIGFVAQAGIALRSAAISRGVARTGVAMTVCLLAMLGISVLYAIVSELTSQPSYYGNGPYRSAYYNRDHSGFFMFAVGILIPLSLGVILILYHRLLAAGRQAAKGGPSARDDD